MAAWAEDIFFSFFSEKITKTEIQWLTFVGKAKGVPLNGAPESGYTGVGSGHIRPGLPRKNTLLITNIEILIIELTPGGQN